MTSKIIIFLIFPCLVIALLLSFAGVEQVEISKPFLALMSSTSRELDSFTIAIPDIPNIPSITNINSGEWYEVIINALNGIIAFLNGLVSVINFLIMVINTLISLIQFIIILIKNVIIFKDTLIQA